VYASERLDRPTASILDVCTDELFESLGLPRWLAANGLARRLARPAVEGFARDVQAFDDRLGLMSLGRSAFELALVRARSLSLAGEPVAATGPALFVANHPGMADAVAIFATIGRDDVKIVANRNPFLLAMPGLQPYLTYVPEAASGRVRLLREVIGHLRAGGAVLLFPGGAIEPDPDIAASGERLLRRWSDSVGLLVRHSVRIALPLSIVPVLVRGVLNPRAQRHVLTRLRREPTARARAGVSVQLALPARFPVDTRVAYGAPLPAGALAEGSLVSAELRHALMAAVLDLANLPADAYQPAPRP
jgi:hypothetical protein